LVVAVVVVEKEAVFISGVNTNEDSPNAQHAPHRPVEEEEVVFTRENREGSAQLKKQLVLASYFLKFIDDLMIESTHNVSQRLDFKLFMRARRPAGGGS